MEEEVTLLKKQVKDLKQEIVNTLKFIKKAHLNNAPVLMPVYLTRRLDKLELEIKEEL